MTTPRQPMHGFAWARRLPSSFSAFSKCHLLFLKIGDIVFRMTGADPATIREWISKAESDVADLTAQAEAIQRRLAQSRVQLGLLYELLASISGEAVARRSDLVASDKSVRERVVESAIQVLRDQGEAMRIQDIHAEFLRRQFPLPGSGTPTNIAAHLIDRSVFTRPRRGWFGLVEWSTDESAPVIRRSSSRRKPR